MHIVTCASLKRPSRDALLDVPTHITATQIKRQNMPSPL